MNWLYNWFIELYRTWTNFIGNAGIAQEIALKFKNNFTTLGYWVAFLILMSLAIGFAVYYYYGYNRLPGFRYRRSHWWAILGISIVCIFIFTFISVWLLVPKILDSAPYYFFLSLINSIYGLIFYFTTSVIVKNKSNAKRTPF